jgi:hypothetical protein
MEKENFTPVLGFGSRRVIGHWDELQKKFIALNKEVMFEAEKEFLNGNNIFPFAVRIMDNKVNECYPTYRAIGAKPEDPRVIIYRTQ